MTSPRAKILYWSLSLGLAGLLLFWSLQGIEWNRVIATLRGAKLSHLAVCATLISMALFLRAYRWRILLLAEGKVSIADAFWATSAGYFGNNFLPARAGEVVRTLMVSARAGLSRTYVLTTALSERMVDAIALVVISAVVLWILPEKPGWLADASRPFAILGFAGVVGIALFPHLEPWCVRKLRSLSISEASKDKLEHLLVQILSGVRSFHDTRRLFGFLALTAIIWCSDAVCTVICAQALGIVIPLPVAFLLITGLGLGSAIPSTPGYVGVYQFIAVSVLTPFGYRRDESIAYILLYQAVSYVVIGAWGLIAFWKRRRNPAPQIEPCPL